MVRRKVDRKTSNASNMGITNNVKNFDGNFIYTDSRSTMSATTVVPVSQLKHKQFKGLLKEHLPISGKRTNMVYDVPILQIFCVTSFYINLYHT